MAGEWCGDRGGKKLFPRLNPWFCFLNIEVLKQYNFEFGDDTLPPVDGRIYDVGCKLYESVKDKGLKILDTERDMDSFFYHYEGMSWRKDDPDYREWGLKVEAEYKKEIEAHRNVDLVMDELTKVGFKYGTDKACDHDFLKHYHIVLNPLREEIKSLLEIGVWKGESIRMWLEYFPNAIITCIDIEDKSNMFQGNDRVRFHRIAQADYIPDETFDIIIDDGSHRMVDQQQTFLNLFPKANKIYILEDLHTSIPPWGHSFGFDGNNSTIDFLKDYQALHGIDLNMIYTNDGKSVSSIIKK